MGTRIRIPKDSVTRLDFPEVCLATGATEGVRYHRTTLTHIPQWARVSVVLCGVLGIVAMIASMKRVRAEVPLTDAAWQRWRRAKHIVTGLAVGAALLLVAPLLFDLPLRLPTGLVGLVGLIAVLVYATTALGRWGPVCREIDDREIDLEIPSWAAVKAIEARLGLAVPEAEAETDVEAAEKAELDRRIDAEIDARW